MRLPAARDPCMKKESYIGSTKRADVIACPYASRQSDSLCSRMIERQLR